MTTQNRSDYQEDHRPPQPAVLARVPWLAAEAGKAAAAAAPPESATPQAPGPEPPSVIASASVDAAPWQSAAGEWRIDRPQPPSNAPAAQAAPPPVTPPTPGRQPSAGAGQRHLRFDPPTSPGSDRAASHAPETTSSPTATTGTWHAALSSIDSAIRQYHRVILLAALLTAAGLMILVLESQHPLTAPSTQTDWSPPLEELDDADAANDPTEPKAVEGDSVDELAPLAEARGPQPDQRRRVASNVTSEQDLELVLQPFEPALPEDNERTSDDQAEAPAAEEAGANNQPESQQQTEASVAAAPTPGEDKQEAEADAEPAPYPSTGAPEIAWHNTEETPSAAEEGDAAPPPNVARLSQEIQSPHEQTRK